MERLTRTPRDDWQRIVESQGLHYHSLADDATAGGAPVCYWDESAYYQFSASEIDALDVCTAKLNEHCLQAAQHIIDRNLLERVGIPASHHDWVRRSWERDEHTIYGRFDLAFDGKQPPKLLEYNADTPTALLEAAVVQWYWLKDVGDPKEVDQFNSIHERLLEIFGILKKRYHGKFYFAAMADSLEDFMTVNYLRDVAMQAGWTTEYIHAEEIGWQPETQQFTDLAEKPIELCFKLYPWEWMVGEEFGMHLLRNTVKWWEPPWKMLLSTKGLLPILYELFPDSPYLLPASFDAMPGRMHVRKALHGREGANVTLIDENGKELHATPGPYDGPSVCQQFWPLPKFNGNFPVIGSWMVNGYACGIGIREDTGFITTNRSRFVPHLFQKDTSSS